MALTATEVNASVASLARRVRACVAGATIAGLLFGTLQAASFGTGGLAFYAGWPLARYVERHRAWHDRETGTLVVATGRQ